MQDIDFLPVQHRQKRVQRRSQPWRIVAVALFIALLATGALSQRARKRRAEKELAAIVPQYELAVGRNRRLAELRAQLDTARNAAELFTYLRHPWPRTQLLAALLAPLPEGITIEQLQITRQTPQDQAPAKRYSRRENEAEDDELAKLPPAARDLRRLRDEFDKATTVVVISGTTGDSGALHRYLGALGRASLFTKAELDSLESAEDGAARTPEFRATLVVRPGYGQPGGPSGPKRTAARADRASGQIGGSPG
ncbi:MAG: hypothetical protein ACYSWU_29440 [Planctomycetota bacterium]|jgi:Tfp pilus assembly protein PilN